MNIVVVEPLGVEKKQLQDILEEKVNGEACITYYDDRNQDVEELILRSKDADVVVLSNLPYPREVIEKCSNLKAIVVAFTGVDHVDMKCCEERGITVCNCAGYSTSAVADLVFGMLISLYRNIYACDARARKEGTKDGLVGFELEGKKFGIVGTGAIGSRVAMIAHAFGCELYAYSRTPKELPGVINVTLKELLETCDVVSLHVPLTSNTKHLVGKEQLCWMKQDAVLINTARGPVVDNEALAEVLQNGGIGGACIDVLDVEPPFAKATSILHAPNTIILPHIAFASKQAMVKRAHIVANNLRAFLDHAPQNVVK